jgi:hypothetical protein
MIELAMIGLGGLAIVTFGPMLILALAATVVSVGSSAGEDLSVPRAPARRSAASQAEERRKHEAHMGRA